MEHGAAQPPEQRDPAPIRACLDCGGTGIDRTVDWDDPDYGFSSELPCDSCDGRGTVPADLDEMSRAFDYDYARLIHTGVSNNTCALEEQTAIPHERVARWRAVVAEPWWQAMRDRAVRDALRIDCRVGGDGPLQHLGWETHIAAAHLLSPDGEEYRADAGEEAPVRDWGESLIAARERRPYDFAFERERDRALAAQKEHSERFLAWRRAGCDADPTS